MYLVIYYPSSALPNVCLTPMEMNDLVKKISSPKEERQANLGSGGHWPWSEAMWAAGALW